MYVQTGKDTVSSLCCFIFRIISLRWKHCGFWPRHGTVVSTYTGGLAQPNMVAFTVNVSCAVCHCCSSLHYKEAEQWCSLGMRFLKHLHQLKPTYEEQVRLKCPAMTIIGGCHWLCVKFLCADDCCVYGSPLKSPVTRDAHSPIMRSRTRCIINLCKQ